MKKLTRTGFVFLDQATRPYLVRLYGEPERPWLFYWHPDNNWVTLRTINQFELMEFYKEAIPDEQAKAYGIESEQEDEN